MKEPEFQYGPLAMAIYQALLWFTPILGFTAHLHLHLLFYYIIFLLFVSFGLRPFLVKTGLYRCYVEISFRLGEKRYEKLTQQRRAEVDKAKRDAQHKRAHRKHPDLPRNW